MPPSTDEGDTTPHAPVSHRLVLRLDRHGRTMIIAAIISVVLVAGTFVASALDMIGPAQRAGRRRPPRPCCRTRIRPSRRSTGSAT
ncbi:hypothetical protein [Phytohabitans rumicis]|uniref:Uncharacterized protein n=1 Tax=Phytohabitans rumicis TaxID=1076125 RepID=A0A6V8LH22_9ACTN|nr:hypothetical protein [Phytohabitans rumicis]GFJ94208.1 hypothetical protein Prum_078500 [Phytohabitans rumicis]